MKNAAAWIRTGLVRIGLSTGKQVPPDELFRRFRAVLESNNRSLEIITDIGETLSGDYLFDIQYVQRSYDDLSASRPWPGEAEIGRDQAIEEGRAGGAPGFSGDGDEDLAARSVGRQSPRVSPCMDDQDPEAAKDLGPGPGIRSRPALATGAQFAVEDAEEAMDGRAPRSNAAVSGVGNDEDLFRSPDQAERSPEPDLALVGPGLPGVRGRNDNVVPIGVKRAVLRGGHDSGSFLADAG